ncbi:DUF4376 domain-containing protein [Agrobacterium tumefaciens]|nr:DUF4376 domain-containing protein [Agrobacterium tumefaciens]CUX59990.1 conserved hypothetical protein [Agrobacterium genomosp. 5 str. CFBP 6626]
MPTFARVEEGAVIEVVKLDKGTEITDAFHPDIAVQLKTCADNVSPGWGYDGKNFKAPETALPTKVELLAYAAIKRFEIETGGIVVNGARMDTSRNSQSMIANAYSFVVNSGAPATKFKAMSGWMTLSSADIKSAALAVGAHVQASFDVEEVADGLIRSEAISSIEEIDALPWPSNT